MAHVALVVDDDTVSRLVVGHILRAQDWIVDDASDTPDAIDLIASNLYNLVISDYHLPTSTGLDLLDAIERSQSTPEFILLTEILEYGALPPELTARLSDQLTKPVSSVHLGAVLSRLFPQPGQ